jgi:peptidoglycan hydrolase-like protein with peptidoglycan-binding domain
MTDTKMKAETPKGLFGMSVISELFAFMPQIINIIDSSATTGGAIQKIRGLLSNPLVQWLESIAYQMYPQLRPELHILAILSHANVNWTMIVQDGLNIVAKPQPPLDVDGVIGPKTIKAIMDFQAAHGLKVTGFVADVEAAILQDALSKMNPANS